MKKARKFRLLVRCPEWTTSDFSIKVNGKEVAAGAQPQSYVAIDRKWKNGDVVEIYLPMQNTIEPLDHETEYLAVKHGPIVLAARTGNQDLAGLVADDGRWSHIAHGSLVPVAETPIINALCNKVVDKHADIGLIAGKNKLSPTLHS